MKNKLFIYIFLFIVFFTSNLFAETIFFDSNNMKITNEGNIINAYGGKTNIPSKKIKIEGDEYIYNKLISELTIIGNVKFLDEKKDIYIESNKIIYNEISNTIYSKGKTFIDIENVYEINSENVLYDRNLMKISSKEDSTVNDDSLNIFNFEEGFLFNIAKEIISSKKTTIIDQNNNNYLFERAKINLKINEIVGKEVRVDFIDSFFGDEENDPLLKGKGAISNNDFTKIYKTVFSTCNMENKKCRGWELQSEEFNHEKKKRIFEYRNSWLKVFNKKFLYFPYFNHPDPTVKRKSGFLIPSYQSSDNLGKSINIPYFHVFSDAKDLTFNPRIYSDNDFILQSEYREAFANSFLTSDFSFNYDSENKQTNTHFFGELTGKFDQNTDYKLQLQNVTNDNYLKIHELGKRKTSPLIVSESLLTSHFIVDKDINENTNITTSFRVYEDLSKTDNDRYQYIFPDFGFSKNVEIDEDYNGNFTFSSSGFQKNYNTNVYEAQLNNDFLFESFDFINNTGIVTDYNLLLKNFNTYGENSETYDENNDHELYSILLLKSEFPLKKEFEYSTNILKPVIQARFSPTNSKNISSDNIRINYDNMLSLNRIGRSDMVEGGKSLSIGLEFEKQNLANETIYGFKIGNIIKDKKNNNLPSKSKLNETRSDVFGNISYNLNENIKFNYDFSYNRDLNYSNFDSIGTKFATNNFVTTFDYITENHDFGDTESISNETTLNFTDEHSLTFNTRKDLKNDFTEFYIFDYEYKTDCLSASVEYSKKFYRDGSLMPDKNLLFLIKFIPFAEIRGSAKTAITQDRK